MFVIDLRNTTIRNYNFSSVGNKNVDTIHFYSNQKRYVDKSVYVKILSENYADKIAIDSEHVYIKDDMLVVEWTMGSVATLGRKLQVQLQFEDTANNKISQSMIVSIALAPTLDISGSIEPIYPTILEHLQEQIDVLKAESVADIRGDCIGDTLTIDFYNANGAHLGTQVQISLPTADCYVGGTWDASTHIITLTKNDGRTTELDLSDIYDKITTVQTGLSAHTENKNNPHQVTKQQVGLGNVDNTSDINKPISTAQQQALDTKVDKVAGKGLSTNDFDNDYKGQVEANTSARHTHTNKALLDTYNQNNADLTDAVDKKHNHTNKALLDTYNQSNADLTDAVAKKHSHANKELLDTYAQTEVNLADAVEKKHSHANKELLDTYDQSNESLADAVSKKHSHSNKSLLDTYAQTEVNLADAVVKKHSHANKTLLDTYDQTNEDITTAVEDAHTHSNKSVLDAMTASFTSEDETKLDNIEAGAQVNIIEGVQVRGVDLPINNTKKVNVNNTPLVHNVDDITLLDNTFFDGIARKGDFVVDETQNKGYLYDKNGNWYLFVHTTQRGYEIVRYYEEDVIEYVDTISVDINDYYKSTEVDNLLSGKQNTIDSSHKLSSDLVDDANHTHKFVTASEKAQITTNKNDIASHVGNTNNPHEVTKAQIGLGNVDNTSDLSKPISTATQTALDGKVDKVTGKGLSTNDFTNTYKGNVDANTTARHAHSNKAVLDATTASFTTADETKLDGIASGAQVNVLEGVQVNGTDLPISSKKVNVDISGKVDKVSGNNKVYGTNGSGAQTSYSLDNGTGYSGNIARRDGNGQMHVPQTPTADDHATSKKYVDDKIAEFAQNEMQVVSALPTTGEEGTIYLLPIDPNDLSKGYNRYIWEDNSWLSLGTTEIDLSDYYTKTEANALYDTKQNVINNNNKLSSDYVDDTNHTHKFVTAQEKSDIASNTSARHTHSNKSLLDTYSQTEANLADAVSKKHSHSNKTILDNTTASYTTGEATKLSGIASGAQVNVIETVKVNGTSLTPTSKAVDVTVPTKTSDITNDSGFITSSDSCAYASSAGSVAWDNVSGKPSFATVATSGSYNDLSNKPTIPSADSGLTNDRYVRFDTSSQGLSSTQKSNARANIGAGTSSFSGNYNDLSNKPTIPTVPTNVSAFTNDAGYGTITGIKLNGVVKGTTGVVDLGTVATTDDFYTKVEANDLLAGKVDKVTGKGLSTNDFTTAYKNKLDGIEAGAQVNTVTSVNSKTGAVAIDASLSSSSTSGTGKVKYLEDFTYTGASSSGSNTVSKSTHTHTVTPTGSVTIASGSTGDVTVGTSITGASYTPSGSVGLTANGSTATGRVTYVQSISSTGASASGSDTFVKGISGGSGSFSPTTKYLSASFSGTSATSGAPSATTSVASSGHTHSVTASGSVGLTENASTATGRIEYVKSFNAGTTPPQSATFTGTNSTAVVTGTTTKYLTPSYTAGTAVRGGTTKYMHFSAGTTPPKSASPVNTSATSASASGSTNAYTELATKYIHWSTGSTPATSVNSITDPTIEITSGDAGDVTVATGINGVSYTPAGDVTLTGTRTETGSGSSARRKLTLTASFGGSSATITPSLTTTKLSATASGTGVTLNTGNAPSLTINTTETGGTAIVVGGTTSSVATGSHTHSYEKTTGVTLSSGTAPSLTINNTQNNGEAFVQSLDSLTSVGGSVGLSTSGTSSTGAIKYLESSSKDGYTPAGNITLNAGTAPTVTTRYMSASFTGSAVTSGTPSGTSTVASSGHTHNTTATGSVSLTANSETATGRIKYLQEATHTHTGASVSSSGTAVTGVTGGTTTATTKYLSGSFSGSGATITPTLNTTKISATFSGNSNTTSDGSNSTTTAVSGVNGGSVSKTTKYLDVDVE